MQGLDNFYFHNVAVGPDGMHMIQTVTAPQDIVSVCRVTNKGGPLFHPSTSASCGSIVKLIPMLGVGHCLIQFKFFLCLCLFGFGLFLMGAFVPLPIV